jgi:hypothetical protein
MEEIPIDSRIHLYYFSIQVGWQLWQADLHPACFSVPASFR